MSSAIYWFRLAIVFAGFHPGYLLACNANPAVKTFVQEAADTRKPAVEISVDAKLIDRLLVWVQENTDYDVSLTRQVPPRIHLCSVGERIEYEGNNIIVDSNLNAAYDSELRRINIVGPWDPGDIRDQSILLHELIHDVQFLNRSWYCLQEPEWEAYKLQDAWLEQQGLVSGFDWMYVYFLSRCPRDHHP